jgi:FixJ family two-component response regulator
MPSVSGLDVQAALLERDIHIPIIFITAYDDNVLRDRALQQGAVAYLRKPLTEQTLLAAIATAVDPKRKHDQAPA